MQPRTHLLCTAVLSAAMCFGTVAIAADTPPAGIASSAEKQEFDKSMQDLDVKYIEAFNRKDAATIASMFSSDAVSVGFSPQIGPSVTGREAIQKGLVLLRHKLRRFPLVRSVPQQGQRGRCLTRATIIRRLSVVMEFGICRSGRSGGAFGSVTGGNASRRGSAVFSRS
jgi:hypothetical protein